MAENDVPGNLLNELRIVRNMQDNPSNPVVETLKGHLLDECLDRDLIEYLSGGHPVLTQKGRRILKEHGG